VHLPLSSTPGSEQHWFEPVAAHLGSAYLRYSFTKGTEQEVAFLVDTLALEAGSRVLDVGCGPGRHAHALARRGIDVVGIDISSRFVELATEHAPPASVANGTAHSRFERMDARAMPFDREFDAVISLCQGGFGLQGLDGMSLAGGDASVLDGIARALRPGGLAAVSAFSAYFQVRFLEATDTFDAAGGVNHERTTIKDESGRDAAVDLWTTCFTPRELRLMATLVGLEVRDVWSVTPGAYAQNAPDLDHPELLLIVEKPPPV
jgi:SAM-dependent methyltransferase